MITIKHRGSIDKTIKDLKTLLKKSDNRSILEVYGERGVEILQEATPKDSGETSSEWAYRIKKTSKGHKLEWYNKNIVDGVNIAIILQYGHATRSGTWVEGRDYINPPMKKLLDDLAREYWEEVRRR